MFVWHGGIVGKTSFSWLSQGDLDEKCYTEWVLFAGDGWVSQIHLGKVVSLEVSLVIQIEGSEMVSLRVSWA